MKKTIFLLVWVTQIGLAQQPVSLILEECYARAMEVNPVSGDKVLLENMAALKLKNHNTLLYPHFELYAQATYQSEVTSIDVSVPGIDIPQPPLDQYKVAMDINQVIYDGGTTRKRKELEKQQLETNLQITEVTLYQLKESVHTIFFTILMLQEQELILDLMNEVVNERIKVARSAVENGIIMQSDLLILLAEQLKLKQQLTEIQINRRSGIEVLGELLEMELDQNVTLVTPTFNLDPEVNINRPEIRLFESQMTQIGLSGNLVKSSRFPRVYAFGQAGYGRPGLNMLSDEFDPYYLVGAKISWNPFDWKQNKRERQVLELKQGQVKNQLENFNQRVFIELGRIRSEIEKYVELMKMDNQIIEMRSRIVKSSTSKLDNGIINSADYISDFNSEKQARINLEIHRMKLLQAQAEYLVKKGE